MAKARLGVGLVAGCMFSWTCAASLQAAPPTVSQMLGFRPKQAGIQFSTPTPQELTACKVELIGGGRAGSSGWLLRDPRGLPLRRYYDSNSDKKVDTWSYYLDGVEVYREFDANFNEKVDQYRWFNSAGMKWGVDIDEDGQIDGWKAISAEETTQEILAAFIKRDFARLRALFITEGEIKGLELPAAETQRIQQIQAAAAEKFRAASTKLGLTDAKWVRFDASLPQCVPGDQLGIKIDLIKQARGTILYEHGGKHDFLQTGEMVQIGLAWRFIEVPGEVEDATKPSAKLQALLEELRKHDANPPQAPEKIRDFNMHRADLILRILPEDKAEQRETWKRQVIECYCAAAQASPDGDTAAYDRLSKFVADVVKDQPNSGLASFAAYRELQAWYSIALAKVKEQTQYPKIQGQWLDRLTSFVQTCAHTDETPEALMQLGMVSESLNREIEAKNWYAKLTKEFPNHPQAPRAAGAIRRLEIEGKPFELASGSFDIAKMRGKMVVVYYWASWYNQYVGDFAQMKALMSKYSGKVDIVCINLDNGPPEAGSSTAEAPGVALAQPGGLDSPLAMQYGIHSLPCLFLIGADGKALSGKVQIGTLEDEVKKHVK